jgi:AcrR family transcriptional regulator
VSPSNENFLDTDFNFEYIIHRPTVGLIIKGHLMARTKKNHDVRKAEILAIAQRLFYTQGYEKTTVEAIIQAGAISKGAFYHYFVSKEDLLDCLVYELTRHIIDKFKAVMNEPGLNALEKLIKSLKMGVEIKTGNVEVLRAYLKVTMSDDNIKMRNKMIKTVTELSLPLYTLLIQQGISEGVFNTPSPEFAARMLIGMGNGLQEYYWKLFADMDEQPEIIAKIEKETSLYFDAMERILGAPRGSFNNLVSQSDIAAFGKGES